MDALVSRSTVPECVRGGGAMVLQDPRDDGWAILRDGSPEDGQRGYAYLIMFVDTTMGAWRRCICVGARRKPSRRSASRRPARL